MRIQRLAPILFGFLLSNPVAPAQDFYLRSDDRVFLLGTPSRGYQSWIETFVLTRFPEFSNTFERSGGPPAGAQIPPGAVAVVDLQDAGPGTPSASPDFLAKAYPQLRLTLLRAGPPPTSSEGVLWADISDGKAHNSNSQASELWTAAAVLRAWRAPSLVSFVEIDALRGAVARAENTTVRDLENDHVIAWSQDDRALPLPIDFNETSVAAAVRSSDFSRMLNQQILRIRGMAAERYSLTIDGELIGAFDRNQLDAGLDLAMLPTPMWKQAAVVHELTLRHNEMRDRRARMLDRPAEQRNSAESRAAIEALDTAEADLVREQRARARPKTHDYELQPVSR